ncbi:MAG: hypothetical protein AAB570_02595 [Patescibacteria group bacterium]
MLAILFVPIALFVLAGQWLKPMPMDRTDMRLGATYSVDYAEYLGLDPIQTFEQIADDLALDFVRIPVYWNRIEKTNDVFDFVELDRLMAIAQAQNIPVVLAIGRKVPRWPECFLPDFAAALDENELADAQLQMMSTVVTRYKDHPALYRWQVENEPYFALFGECPKPDFNLIHREVILTRFEDQSTPIQMTASGERSLYLRAASLADEVGISMYRTIHSDVFGQVTYPIPPWTYRVKERLVAPGRVYVSELQMEPWFGRSVHTYTADEQLALFNADTFEAHMRYAEAVGLPTVSLWGVEWWYYLKEKGESSLWEAAKRLYGASN